MKFTDRALTTLKGSGSRRIIYEDSAHGQGTLGVRVGASGSKSWILRYTFDGRDRTLTLGKYPLLTIAAARSAAADATLQIELGSDPGAVVVAANIAKREAPTVEELAELYLEGHARKNKRATSVARDEGMLRYDILPAFGTRKAEGIQRADVRELLRRIVDRDAPVKANRTLALMRKMYNWAVSEDLVAANQCLGISAPGKETPRDRVLSEAELRALFAGLADAPMSPAVRLVLRLLVLTAQRCGEILGARWSEFDLDGGWWTIPAERAKNGLSHRVPLSAEAREGLSEARALNPDGAFVFPSPRGDRPLSDGSAGLAVRRSRAHFALTGRWTPHDLRRTAASQMTGMGISRLVVAKILNHAEQGVTAVYDRYSYDRDKREALVAWGARVGVLAGAVEAVEVPVALVESGSW